jgi:hypothetical protein
VQCFDRDTWFAFAARAQRPHKCPVCRAPVAYVVQDSRFSKLLARAEQHVDTVRPLTAPADERCSLGKNPKKEFIIIFGRGVSD